MQITVQLYRMECVILRCYGDTNYLGNRLGRLHTKQFCVCICCALVFTGNISHNHNHPPRAFVSHDTNQPITELYSSHMTQTGQSSWKQWVGRRGSLSGVTLAPGAPRLAWRPAPSEISKKIKNVKL